MPKTAIISAVRPETQYARLGTCRPGRGAWLDLKRRVLGSLSRVVAGSGLRFSDRGTTALKGVEGDWHLYAVDRTAAAG